MVSDMLLSGLELMLLGMGMVFLFLVLLIIMMQAMSRLASRLVPETPMSDTLPHPRTVGGGSTDPRIIAAIAVAVRRFRGSRGA